MDWDNIDPEQLKYLPRKQLKELQRRAKAELPKIERAIREAEQRQAEIKQEIQDILIRISNAVKEDRLKQQEFYELAMQPSFPDQMAFQLESKDGNPETTFSKEGFDSISEQVMLFTMARTYARYVQGKQAKQLRIEVNLVWETLPEGDEAQDLPWFHLEDPGKFLQVSGLHRLPLDK